VHEHNTITVPSYTRMTRLSHKLESTSNQQIRDIVNKVVTSAGKLDSGVANGQTPISNFRQK